jgi:cysteine desulfurase/selenocysteine lyase
LNYREQFPVTENLLYMNHASVAPLSRRCAEAMQKLAQDALDYGSFHYSDWMDTYGGLRSSAAKLISATPAEIAIVKNTSEGIATVAMGIDWQPGDIVVCFREEFPANLYPWQQLEPKGVQIRWLSIFDPIEEIDKACNGARLLAISYVQYLSGYRVNLKEIGEICTRHDCFFFVDAIQGLGAFSIHVERDQIDALAADAHKWLLGPEGCGFLYVRHFRQDEIKPVEFGWTNVASYSDYSSRDMALRANAGRYECGTLNTIGCHGVRAALDLILEVGVTNITKIVQEHGDRIWEGVKELGFETLGTRTKETGAGIVSFRQEGVESQLIVKKLKDEGIIVAPRQGWVRVSPHFYIEPEGIDRLLSELAKF